MLLLRVRRHADLTARAHVAANLGERFDTPLNPAAAAPQVMDHDTVLFFSPDGIARSLKAYQIPQSSRTAAGTPLSQVCETASSS